MAGLNIIVVDDNKIFRNGVCFYLTNILKHNVVGESEDGEQFLQMANVSSADVVLMDIEMPKINGLDAIKMHLWHINHETKAIAITNYEEKVYLTELIGAGFKGCVFKKNIYNELETAIKQIMNGEIYYPENIKL